MVSIVGKLRQRIAKRARARRVRLLNAEVEAIGVATAERTRSLDAKASFVVVSAGLLAGGVGATLIRPESSFAGLVPLALTIWTVVEAAAALWPLKLKVAGARRLIDNFVDTSESLDAIEDKLLELKTREIENRNTKNEERAAHTRLAFLLLVLSLIASLLVAILNAYLESIGVSLVGTNQTNTPTPAP